MILWSRTYQVVTTRIVLLRPSPARCDCRGQFVHLQGQEQYYFRQLYLDRRRSSPIHLFNCQQALRLATRSTTFAPCSLCAVPLRQLVSPTSLDLSFAPPSQTPSLYPYVDSRCFMTFAGSNTANDGSTRHWQRGFFDSHLYEEEEDVTQRMQVSPLEVEKGLTSGDLWETLVAMSSDALNSAQYKTSDQERLV